MPFPTRGKLPLVKLDSEDEQDEIKNHASTKVVNLLSESSEGATETSKASNVATVVNPDQLRNYILDSLAFKSMKDRQEEVAAAHQETFEWIFDDTAQTDHPGHSFLTWLRATKGDIYWINGKAGSGKSTLLRFIYDHKKGTQELEQWADSKPLSKAGFFFWTSGSYEQRSQAGLLRSLLYQLLEPNQDLISVAFPDIWERYRMLSTLQRIKIPLSWELGDLMQGLRFFLKKAVETTKICLFIDGLDEFDGDHKEVIALFKGIMEDGKGNVKVCLSSRPWPVFEEAFKSIPCLKLQDLTLKDREQYVTDSFTKDPRTKKIIDSEPEDGRKLMDEIVQRADGVFLWVILVVRSLLTDLQANDKISDLTRNLQMLPTDLDEFFAYILFQTQETNSTTKASEIFQLIRAREIVCDFTKDYDYSSMTLRELALACSPEDDMIRDGSIFEESEANILRECREMITTLVETCAGLLEIHSKRGKKNVGAISNAKVTYLHRTVRDWLLYSPEAWTRL